MKNSEFVCDCIDEMYYKCNKMSSIRCRSYIDSPEWLKTKKTTINPKNNNDTSFQYAATVALNHKTKKIYKG